MKKILCTLGFASLLFACASTPPTPPTAHTSSDELSRLIAQYEQEHQAQKLAQQAARDSTAPAN